MEIELHLGDPVEVTVVSKHLGYLFKSDKEEMVLCSSKDYNPDNLTVLKASEIIQLTQFKSQDLVPGTPADPSKPPQTQVTEVKDMGELVTFPGPKGGN